MLLECVTEDFIITSSLSLREDVEKMQHWVIALLSKLLTFREGFMWVTLKDSVVDGLVKEDAGLVARVSEPHTSLQHGLHISVSSQRIRLKGHNSFYVSRLLPSGHVGHLS